MSGGGPVSVDVQAAPREQVMLEAAKLIEARGLGSGELFHDGKVCLASAVGIVAAGLPQNYDGNDWRLEIVILRGAEQTLGASYSEIYCVSDIQIYRRRQRGRKLWQRRLSRETRAANLLRRMAEGQTFKQAAVNA